MSTLEPPLLKPETAPAPLPPRQQLARPGYWPLVGEREPRYGPEPWGLEICGLVSRPFSLTMTEVADLANTAYTLDIHCVTRWSMLGAKFTGIDLGYLVGQADPLPGAAYLSFVARSVRSHSTSLPLSEALDLGAFVATHFEGKPLGVEHGGPIRMVVPGKYFYKSVKWLERIEVLADDRLGYWEAEAGYHNEADPWKEQRYITEGIDPDLQHLALKRKDFSGLNLRSLNAAGRNLAGLEARRALLRDANFRGADLQGAQFALANLSNAHFDRAVLSNASFAKADVEGADFTGADLRGADFTGAALSGVTFYWESEGAIIDRTTQFDADGLDLLTEDQREFVLRRLK